MNQEEMKDDLTVSSTEEMGESSDRRSFMKSTLIAAAAAAVGTGLTGSIAEAANIQEGAAAAPAIGKRKASKLVNVRFPQTAPTLDDLQKIIAQTVGRYGCPACGLLGIDIRLGLDDIVKVGRGITPVQLDAGVQVNAVEQVIRR